MQSAINNYVKKLCKNKYEKIHYIKKIVRKKYEIKLNI